MRELLLVIGGPQRQCVLRFSLPERNDVHHGPLAKAMRRVIVETDGGTRHE